MKDINIHIDELVLRGISVADRGQFLRAFRRELERGLRSAWSDPAAVRAWAGAHAEPVGNRAAGIVPNRRASLPGAGASSRRQGRDAARAVLGQLGVGR